MKNKFNKFMKVTIAIVVAVVTVFLIDFIVSKKSGILDGVDFSGAYSDSDGNLLQVYLTNDESFRIYKNVSEFPPDFLEALLLQEDKKFYSHIGINPVSLFRAGIETYIKKSRRIGASTITMQTVKLKKHLYTKNLSGKLSQIFSSLRMELLFSKQDILDAYINLAPCGKNIEGFETASYYFFGKSISETDLSEKLLLCVLPQNPTKRCPSKKNIPAELIEARKRLFEQWCELHPEDSDLYEFMTTPPQLVCQFPEIAPHFTRMIELNESANFPCIEKIKIGNKGIVKTTIKSSVQNILSERLSTYLKQNRHLGINNASLLLLNFQTMEIEAAIGSGGFYDDSILGQIDGNISKRSPGSTLKPFIYAMALDQGKIHFSTMLKDTPSSFSEYTPDNYGYTFKGPMKAWEALTQSRNIPAVTLAKEIKNPDLYDFLQKSEITNLRDKDTYGLSIVLGSADVSPFELINLYASLVNDGYQKKIKIVKDDFSDSSKKSLPPPIISTESAFIVRKMLEQNPPPEETRSREAKSFPIGYKTGTSIGFRDSWSIGFFGQYILCVWIGNFDAQGNNAFLGRSAAAPLFFSIADTLIAERKCKRIYDTKPKGVSEINVCKVSGNIPNEFCDETEKTFFIPGVSPISKCKIHRQITIDTRTGYRTNETDKPYCQNVVREFWPSDLMALFKEAGLPRLEPPDYPPNLKNEIHESHIGFPPQILSPLSYAQYILRESSPEHNSIILQASADGDTSELFWFAGSDFICRSVPGEKSLWTPKLGTYDITVLDSKGRSNSRKITVQTAD